MGQGQGDGTVNINDPFCQRNGNWTGLPLGTAANSTIGGQGCLICSVAKMLQAAAGVTYTPWELNKKLVEVGGYANGNELVFGAISRIEPRILFLERRDYSNRAFPIEADAEIQALLARGGMAIVQVNFRFVDDPGHLHEHWLYVLKIQRDEQVAPFNAWFCFDPWYGEMVEAGQFYSPYGRGLDYAVHGLALYQLR